MIIILPSQFIKGVELFNQEDFFGQHDIFEELWIKSEKNDKRRLLYQGILNIGVGFYHFKNGNLNGSKKQLQKGVSRLKDFYELANNNKYRLKSKVSSFNWLKIFIEESKNWQDWLTNTKNYKKNPLFPKIELFNFPE
ncbi:MAG: hypothetical protein HeimC3_10410 [Candidatus Heimdallarchaeota archaeon LC_3]|nr:MAG: hypothetical protein HeimC3_10410 [Candidatus Heimdallarchaeota archaeon LC_3]